MKRAVLLLNFSCDGPGIKIETNESVHIYVYTHMYVCIYIIPLTIYNWNVLLRSLFFGEVLFIVIVQSQSHVRLFASPWTAAHQASLSMTNSQSLLKLMSTEPSNRLILCHPLLLLPSIFPSILVFSDGLALRIRWPKNWSFSISPSDE